MALLILLVLIKLLHGAKFNPRKFHRTVKKQSKVMVKFGKQFVQLENRMINRVGSIMEKNVCQEVVKIDNKNVIDFTEYKLKKAK